MGGNGGVTVSRPREIVPMNLQMVDVVRDMFVLLCCVVVDGIKEVDAPLWEDGCDGDFWEGGVGGMDGGT